MERMSLQKNNVSKIKACPCPVLCNTKFTGANTEKRKILQHSYNTVFLNRGSISARIGPTSSQHLATTELCFTIGMIQGSIALRSCPLRSVQTFSRGNFSTTSPKLALPLAFKLHEPPTSKSHGAPIVFMHGLFGSKQNNRSISK